MYQLFFWLVWLLMGIAGVCGLGWWMSKKKLEEVKANEEKVMRRARHRALKIVRGARDRAVEIINQAGGLAAKQETWLDEQVKQATQEKLAGYKGMLDKFYQEEVKEFETTLEEETKQEYQEAKKRVAEYEAEKVGKIEEATGKIVGEVLKRVTGRVIPVDQHKELIREAVEEARREHIL